MEPASTPRLPSALGLRPGVLLGAFAGGSKGPLECQRTASTVSAGLTLESLPPPQRPPSGRPPQAGDEEAVLPSHLYSISRGGGPQLLWGFWLFGEEGLHRALPGAEKKSFPGYLCATALPLVSSACRTAGHPSWDLQGLSPNDELSSAHDSSCSPQPLRSLWGAGREMGNCSRSRFAPVPFPALALSSPRGKC